MQSVLRCKECNKPFDKESTLKRHGYYCRKRTAKPVRRAPSCISCARKKARCDRQSPACLKCVHRGVECIYPSRKTSLDHATLYNNKDLESGAPLWQYDTTEPTLNPFVNNNLEDLRLLDSPLADSNVTLDSMTLANINDGAYDWADIEMDMPAYPEDVIVANSSLRTRSGSESISLNQSMPPETVWDLQHLGTPNIPRHPSVTVRSFNQRLNYKASKQRITKLIFHNLRSYPLMLQSDDNLPPFIHPATLGIDRISDDIEPLRNCISLTRMLASKATANRKLFWKNVKMECEQICEEHVRMSDWGLVTTMQALSLYLLNRLEEGETDHNNVDALLTSTILIVARHTVSRDVTRNSLPMDSNQSLESKWQQWILDESMSRLCSIYQIVNMVVYFEPASMCELHLVDLVLAPLPASRQLWQSKDAKSWNAKLVEMANMPTFLGMDIHGDLVSLDGEKEFREGVFLPQHVLKPSIHPRKKHDWLEWCAGIDGLGSLILLAASLVG